MTYLNPYSSISDVDKVLKLYGNETTAWYPNPLNFKAILNDSNFITIYTAARPLYFLRLCESCQLFTFAVFAAYGPVRTKRIFVVYGPCCVL